MGAEEKTYESRGKRAEAREQRQESKFANSQQPTAKKTESRLAARRARHTIGGRIPGN
jgi:hypothetical protein